MSKKASLIIQLIFWLCILFAIVVIPEVGIFAAIIAAFVFIYKKICHIPIMKIKRK